MNGRVLSHGLNLSTSIEIQWIIKSQICDFLRFSEIWKTKINDK